MQFVRFPKNKNNASDTKQKRHGSVQFLCSFFLKNQQKLQYTVFMQFLAGAVRYFSPRSAFRTFGKTHVFCAALRSAHSSCSLSLLRGRLMVIPPRFPLFLPSGGPITASIIPPTSPLVPSTGRWAFSCFCFSFSSTLSAYMISLVLIDEY